MEIKPIQTRYNGYLFRSRLEARWAVFMDALDIPYVYEPEGYDLGDGYHYLPDFYLPKQEWFLEIKPQALDRREIELARRLAEQSGNNVVAIEGTPGMPESYYEGQIIEAVSYYASVFYGNLNQDYTAKNHTKEHLESLAEFLQRKQVSTLNFDGTMTRARELIELDKAWYQGEHGREHPYWYRGVHANHLFWTVNEDSREVSVGWNATAEFRLWTNAALAYAYSTAREARFEHGKTPRAYSYWLP